MRLCQKSGEVMKFFDLFPQEVFAIKFKLTRYDASDASYSSCDIHDTSNFCEIGKKSN